MSQLHAIVANLRPVRPLYYLKRGDKYLNWSGHHFTDDETCAWLGTADHFDAFREHHPLASADGIKVIAAIPSHSEEDAI